MTIPSMNIAGSDTPKPATRFDFERLWSELSRMRDAIGDLDEIDRVLYAEAVKRLPNAAAFEALLMELRHKGGLRPSPAELEDMVRKLAGIPPPRIAGETYERVRMPAPIDRKAIAPADRKGPSARQKALSAMRALATRKAYPAKVTTPAQAAKWPYGDADPMARVPEAEQGRWLADAIAFLSKNGKGQSIRAVRNKAAEFFDRHQSKVDEDDATYAPEADASAAVDAARTAGDAPQAEDGTKTPSADSDPPMTPVTAFGHLALERGCVELEDAEALFNHVAAILGVRPLAGVPYPADAAWLSVSAYLRRHPEIDLAAVLGDDAVAVDIATFGDDVFGDEKKYPGDNA